VYDKAEGKTKNDYFQDMLADVLAWGLAPAFITGDSWYSCVNNLNMIKNHQIRIALCTGKQPIGLRGKKFMGASSTTGHSRGRLAESRYFHLKLVLGIPAQAVKVTRPLMPLERVFDVHGYSS